MKQCHHGNKYTHHKFALQLVDQNKIGTMSIHTGHGLVMMVSSAACPTWGRLDLAYGCFICSKTYYHKVREILCGQVGHENITNHAAMLVALLQQIGHPLVTSCFLGIGWEWQQCCPHQNSCNSELAYECATLVEVHALPLFRVFTEFWHTSSICLVTGRLVAPRALSPNRVRGTYHSICATSLRERLF